MVEPLLHHVLGHGCIMAVAAAAAAAGLSSRELSKTK
jgi:hypothetical protein